MSTTAACLDQAASQRPDNTILSVHARLPNLPDAHLPKPEHLQRHPRQCVAVCTPLLEPAGNPSDCGHTVSVLASTMTPAYRGCAALVLKAFAFAAKGLPQMILRSVPSQQLAQKARHLESITVDQVPSGAFPANVAPSARTFGPLQLWLLQTAASRDRLLCACVAEALRRSSASPPRSNSAAAPMPLPMHMDTMPKRADLPRRCISCSSVAVARAPADDNGQRWHAVHRNWSDTRKHWH